MIRPPDVVEKYAPDAIMVLSAMARRRGPDQGDPVANLEAWGGWRLSTTRQESSW